MNPLNAESMTPTQVAEHLIHAGRQLSAAQADLAMLDTDATNKKVAHELAYAQAILNAEGGNDGQRKAAAVLACQRELLAAEIAACKVRAGRERIAMLRSTVDTLRSLAVAARSEFQAGGYAA